MKKLLLTGATGGIGKAICQVLEDDYDISVIGRNKAKVETLCTEFKNISNFFLCDLGDQKQLNLLLEEISAKGVKFDILINNAGVTSDSLFLRMDRKKWDSVMQTNLNANFSLTNAISKTMIKNRWGRIINITSIIAHTGNVGQANYSASKAGLVAMSKSVAQELARRNITVNCISPGFIETNMTSVLSDDQQKAILSKIPMGKIGSPLDVANCVKFLVSEESNYITGQTIHINGGMAML